MKTTCALQRRRVRTTDGRALGRAYDLRCEWRAGRVVVTALVYGRRGLLERLGFRGERFDTLPWGEVAEIDEWEIVVDAAEAKPRAG